MSIQMSSSQCPNIKTDILAMRRKIGELKGLKLDSLRGYDGCEEKVENIQKELDVLIISIETKNDITANEMILPRIQKSEKYGAVSSFLQARAAAIDMDGYEFHIKYNGEPLYSIRYKKVGDYYEGRAMVQDFDGKYSHIRLDGQPLYNTKYRLARDFSQGKAIVRDFSGNQFWIDLNGNLIAD
jgi:WG containing repeat